MRMPSGLPAAVNHGLVVGNSGISADVSASGNLFQRVIFNPPTFAPGPNSLKDAGRTAFFFGDTVDCELDWTVQEHTYPRYRACAQLSSGLRLSVLSYAPVSAVDPELIFLPAIVVEFSFENPSASDLSLPVSFTWQQGKFPFEGEASFDQASGLAVKGSAFASASGCAELTAPQVENGLGLCAQLHIAAGEKTALRVAFGIFEKDCRWRTKCKNAAALSAYVHSQAASLSAHLQDFIAFTSIAFFGGLHHPLLCFFG